MCLPSCVSSDLRSAQRAFKGSTKRQWLWRRGHSLRPLLFITFFQYFLYNRTDNGVSEWVGCRLQLGRKCCKEVARGQGGCCQIESSPASEIRPRSPRPLLQPLREIYGAPSPGGDYGNQRGWNESTTLLCSCTHTANLQTLRNLSDF